MQTNAVFLTGHFCRFTRWTLALGATVEDMKATIHKSPVVNISVGREVKAWAARLGYKQADLAKLLGIPQSSASGRLNGRQPFQLDELLILAQEFRVTLGELLGEEIVKARSPRDLQDREDSFRKLPRLDSNQQPFD